jgi:hypothetical protein
VWRCAAGFMQTYIMPVVNRSICAAVGIELARHLKRCHSV